MIQFKSQAILYQKLTYQMIRKIDLFQIWIHIQSKNTNPAMKFKVLSSNVIHFSSSQFYPTSLTSASVHKLYILMLMQRPILCKIKLLVNLKLTGLSKLIKGTQVRSHRFALSKHWTIFKSQLTIRPECFLTKKRNVVSTC